MRAGLKPQEGSPAMIDDVRFDPETGEILEPAAPPAPAKKKRARKKPNGRAPIPENEGRREKFVRLANNRYDRIVKAIHTMRGLGRNQSSYDYGDADIDQITDMLVAELEAMKAELKRRGRPQQTKLNLQ
jgi:hypothetical protein